MVTAQGSAPPRRCEEPIVTRTTPRNNQSGGQCTGSEPVVVPAMGERTLNNDRGRKAVVKRIGCRPKGTHSVIGSGP